MTPPDVPPATDAEVEEFEKALKKMAGGVWVPYKNEHGWGWVGPEFKEGTWRLQERSDAEGICALRNLAPRILARLRESEQVLVLIHELSQESRP